MGKKQRGPVLLSHSLATMFWLNFAFMFRCYELRDQKVILKLRTQNPTSHFTSTILKTVWKATFTLQHVQVISMIETLLILHLDFIVLLILSHNVHNGKRGYRQQKKKKERNEKKKERKKKEKKKKERNEKKMKRIQKEA